MWRESGTWMPESSDPSSKLSHFCSLHPAPRSACSRPSGVPPCKEAPRGKGKVSSIDSCNVHDFREGLSTPL